MIVLGREISKFAEDIITETQEISSKKLIFINTNKGGNIWNIKNMNMIIIATR